jgi:phage shock protein C
MGLYRSRRSRILGGVCGGIAEWVGWRPFTVRLLYCALSIPSVIVGPAAYVALWIVMPRAPETIR